MDFIDDKGVIHKNFPVWKADKLGWKIYDSADKEEIKIKEVVEVIAEEE